MSYSGFRAILLGPVELRSHACKTSIQRICFVVWKRGKVLVNGSKIYTSGSYLFKFFTRLKLYVATELRLARNYSYLFNLRQNICKSSCLNTVI